MRRLELPTSTSRTWRASQLCYIPILFATVCFSITGAKVHLFFEPAIPMPTFFQEKFISPLFVPFCEKSHQKICLSKNNPYLCSRNRKQRYKKLLGAIAQLVEQRTENPCVPGSIPGGTTLEIKELLAGVTLFLFKLI